jgi:hypothetical protein
MTQSSHEAQIRPPGGLLAFHPGKRPGTAGFEADRDRIDGRGNLKRPAFVSRAQLADAPTNAQDLRSTNLARTNRCMTAKTIAAETPNMSAPFVASSGPSNRHDRVRSRSPEPSVV